MKTLERIEARRLREELGWPLKRIATELGVAVSSVSLWVRDIELTPEQHAVLRDLNPLYNRQLRSQGNRRVTARYERRCWQEKGRCIALGRNDDLHRMGCMLYWAEGAKNRNSVAFTNSDLDMHRLFMRFLRDCYGVHDEDFVVTVNLHLGNGMAAEEIRQHWLDVLMLPPTCLRKGKVVPPSDDPIKRGKLPYGTVRVAVHSTKLVQSIYGAIQEYAGFSRPAWLD